MRKLRMIYTRGPHDTDEEIHFTDNENEESADDWAKPGWKVISDDIIMIADGGAFTGQFPSEHSFARTS